MSSLPLVLHVLPMDLARGAQRYVRALRDALNGREAEHKIATLFSGPNGVLSADIALSVPPLGRRLGFEPRVVPALTSLIRHERPGVLVAHGNEPLKYIAAVPTLTPVIYYKIGIATDAAREGARRAFHGVLQRRATWVAGVSQECLDEARTVFGVPDGKLVLIPNGRDPSLFFPREESVAAGAPPTILWVGRFVQSKRPEVFIDVVERIRQQGVPLTARMVGDGPLRSGLQRRAEALGIELLGVRDDVPEVLRAGAVLLFTSAPEGEGMPGVLVEAGLSGLPVVTTAIPGARTVVAEGNTGYVVDVSDVQGLAARTATLLRDDALRRRMGLAARARCEKDFTLERSATLWEALLRRTLA